MSRRLNRFTPDENSEFKSDKFLTEEEFAERLRSVDLTKIQAQSYVLKERQLSKKI